MEKPWCTRSSKFRHIDCRDIQSYVWYEPSEYQQYKGLKRENLRDHMTDLELIFSMLGEASITEITRRHDAQGFGENKKTAKAGGKIAGDARKQLEKASGQTVITKDNYLPQPKKIKEKA